MSDRIAGKVLYKLVVLMDKGQNTGFKILRQFQDSIRNLLLLFIEQKIASLPSKPPSRLYTA